MDYQIRELIPADFEQLFLLIQEFSIFEKSQEKVTNSPQLMLQEQDLIKGFVVELDDGIIVAYSTYFFTYHSWVGKCLHMDDLYIQANFRKHGLGKQLIKTVIDFAKSQNCKQIRWQVSDWNSNAQQFYKNLGAEITNSEYDCFIRL